MSFRRKLNRLHLQTIANRKNRVQPIVPADLFLHALDMQLHGPCALGILPSPNSLVQSAFIENDSRVISQTAEEDHIPFS